MHKTNVLHIIDTLSIGGAEKIMVGTVNSLPQFTHHVIYLSGSNALQKDLPADCKVTKLNFSSKLDTIRCVLAIKKYIRDNHIEIVHSHLVMATVIARLACPRKVKLFSTIHSLLGSRCFSRNNFFQRFVERITYKRRHHVIGVSEEVLKDYDNCIGIKGEFSLLPNFISDSFFKPDFKRMSFNGTFRMVMVGSLKPAKNYQYVVEAFKKLPKGIHLDIYGDGPLKQELQSVIDNNKLNIRLCGSRNDIHQLLQNYDLYVMSSQFEGHPLSLLEAMAGGMPAAVSDIPVLREATNNDSIFFDLKNVDDFIQKIKAIAAHTVDLDPYAARNFERVKSIAGRENYMHTLKSIYNSSLRTRPEVYKQTPPVEIFRPALRTAAAS